jgi:hypothetical protein
MAMKLLLIALGIVAVVGPASRAEAQNYPWCAILNMGDEAKNCGFTTIEQCRASVSGIGGFCMRDPQYQPPAAVHARSWHRQS